jgi:uncharacterized membrane protein (DUF485 family)
MRIGTIAGNYWTGLVVLLVGYLLLQLLYFYPTDALPEAVKGFPLSPVWWLLAVVYLAGGWILNQVGVRWQLVVWHVVHIFLISYAMTVLAVSRFIGSVPYSILSTVRPILEFLISPVLYIAMGLLYKASRK